MIKTQSQRIVVIGYYVIMTIVALRAVLSFSGNAAFTPVMTLVAIFGLVLVAEPGVSRRWSAFRWIYFGVQTALVVGMALLVTSFDFLWVLYLILAGQAYYYLPRGDGDRSVRTDRVGSLVVDFASDGRPIGVEITTPSRLVLGELNQLLSKLGQVPVAKEDLAPLAAA